jgi:hypothetical protein
MCDSRQGFGLKIGLIDVLQVVNTNNYNPIANLHTLQFTTLHAVFQSAFTSRFPVTELNNGDSTTAPTKPSIRILPYKWLNSKLVQVIISRLGPRRKHRYFCTTIVSLGRHLFEKALHNNGYVYLFFKNLVYSRECCFVVCFEVVTQ